ncbi:MAG: hypothetical protein AAGE59_34845 [Cyanobacteria bacterium P01_F01_bin.86]
MMRFIVAVLLTAAFVSSVAGFVSADSPEMVNDSYPVVAQLVLRDRTITITSAPEGYLYSVADESGNLSAGLTESQMAAQYPELLDALRPAVAEEGATLMMLAPAME